MPPLKLPPWSVRIAAGAVLAVLIVAFMVLSTIDWDSPRLGAAVLERVGKMAGVELKVGSFRLNLIRGLTLSGVQLRAAFGGTRIDAAMDRLVLQHRLLHLLSGRVVVDRLVLERPEIFLHIADEPPPTPAAGRAGGRGAPPAAGEPAGAEAPAGGGLDLRLSRLAIRDGKLVVHFEGDPAPYVDMQGLDLELRELRSDPGAASVLAGLSGEGKLSAGATSLDVIRAEELDGRVRIADGHVRLERIEMPANLGRFEISELDLDLTRDPYRFALALEGDPLNADELLGAPGRALGRSRLAMRTTGGLGETLDLAGEGTLTLGAGKLPASPALAALDDLLPRLPIVGAAFKPFEVHFRLRGEEIVADLFEIVAGDLRLGAQGVVGLDETLDLRFVAKARRELIESPEIPPAVLEALTDADGQVNLPMLVRGSQARPVARFDRSQWAEMARARLRQEAGRRVQEGVGRGIGELLDGRRRDRPR